MESRGEWGRGARTGKRGGEGQEGEAGKNFVFPPPNLFPASSPPPSLSLKFGVEGVFKYPGGRKMSPPFPPNPSPGLPPPSNQIKSFQPPQSATTAGGGGRGRFSVFVTIIIYLFII